MTVTAPVKRGRRVLILDLRIGDLHGSASRAHACAAARHGGKTILLKERVFLRHRVRMLNELFLTMHTDAVHAIPF
jgi:hypothetical protein